MFYHLFQYIEKVFDFPGAGVFQYISFRAALTIIFSLIISLFLGKKIIFYLQKKQIGEEIRNLGLHGQMQKKGTPTMGGVIILGAILLPTIFFADLTNVYVLIMLMTTVWLGLLGFTDDYIKVFKKYKEGLPGRYKIIAQGLLGLVIAFILYSSEDVVVRKKITSGGGFPRSEIVEEDDYYDPEVVYTTQDIKSTITTIPFFKDNEFDYAQLIGFMGDNAKKYAWGVLFLAIIIIVMAVSNGANITDGLDGLAAGTSAIIGTTLGVLAYLSGNMIYAEYLNIMYIPLTGELVVFMGAFIGALIGFLWYNSYPAQVFMGDTGSLSLGGIIAVFAIIIRKELLIPILCGIFFVENVSVMIQVMYFKYTKRKYGEGRRIFKMAPLHHHYQKLGYPEPKIVTRFWIVGILLAVITIVTLKIR